MNKEEFISIVQPYTMTSLERIVCLYDSLEYVRQNNVEGDIVECGVWRGGNIIGIAAYLSFYKMNEKKIYAYDTFTGMTTSQSVDVDHRGQSATPWTGACRATLQDVKENVLKSNLHVDNINYIVGDVCETLCNTDNIPRHISLLRLDTDWYQSTKKELEVLFPVLDSNGVLIIDDYGHWKGSKKATDEYFLNNIKFFQKIDYTGICLYKNKII
jgi:hypothetical protein